MGRIRKRQNPRKPPRVAPDISRERHLQELGHPTPACMICGLIEPEGLRKMGLYLLEADHIDGAANSDLQGHLCKNHHDLRHASLRSNEDLLTHVEQRSPLEQMAAARLGRGALFDMLAVHNRAEAQWLLEAERRLKKEYGERWWDILPPFPGRSLKRSGAKK